LDRLEDNDLGGVFEYAGDFENDGMDGNGGSGDEVEDLMNRRGHVHENIEEEKEVDLVGRDGEPDVQPAPVRLEFQPSIVDKHGELAYCEFSAKFLNGMYGENVLEVRTQEEFILHVSQNKTISHMEENMGMLSQFDNMVGKVRGH
jgi:hypothetical protein